MSELASGSVSQRPGWVLVADLDLCQAHQMCLLEAPDLVGFDKAADSVVVLHARPGQHQRGQAERAVVHCPALALAIVESAVESPAQFPVEEE